MKIIIINNLFPPGGKGGAEHFVERQAKELVRKGNDIVVITSAQRARTEHYRNFKIIRLKQKNIYHISDAKHHMAVTRLLWTFFDLFNIFSYLQLKKILKREHPQRVICHNIKGMGYLLPDLLRILEIKYVQYIHDVQLAIPSGILYTNERSWHTTGFLQKFYAHIVRNLIGSPKEVVSLSHWLLTYYQKQHYFQNSKATVLPFTLREHELESIKKKFSALKKKIEEKDEIALLYVGKIEKHKGVWWLLEQSKKFPKNVYILFVGGGSDAEALKKATTESTVREYISEKNREELKEYYQKADMLIMPTLCYENRPQVIVEALQSGLPVMASNVGGISEIIKDGVTGVLINPFDEGSIVNFFR